MAKSAGNRRTERRHVRPSTRQTPRAVLPRSRASTSSRVTLERTRRLAAIFEHALDAIIVSDDAGRYVAANRAACKLVGYSNDEFLTLRVGDLVGPERSSAALSTWRTMRETGFVSGTNQVFRKDGALIDIEFRGVAHVLPGLHAVFFRDITRTKRAIEAARRQTEIVGQIQEGIVTTDLAGNITSFNPGAERLSGYSAGEVIGRHVGIFYYPEDRQTLAASLGEPVIKDGRGDFEVRIRRKEGPPFFGHLHISVLRDEDGRPIGLIRSIVDETGRIKSARELKRSRDQLRSVWARVRSIREEQLRTLSRELHDQIGQSLMALKMDVHWLQQHAEAPEGAPGGLNAKLESMLLDVVTTIRQVRKLSASLRPTVLDRLGLLPAIHEQAKEFERRTGIRCRVESELESYDLDSTQATEAFRVFEQALTNVAEHASANSVMVKLSRMSAKLILSVADNGLGIPIEAITSARSLGLIGMRERAALLGAFLRVERGTPKGTIVTLRIPSS